MIIRNQLAGVFCLIGIAILSACATEPKTAKVVQLFNETRGASVIALQKPIVLAAEAPQLGVNVRDYLHVGPVEISSAGEKRHYLWIARWSSIDRQVLPQWIAEEANTYLWLDGEPMELGEPTAANELPRAGLIPYSVPVSSASEQYYLLTRAQLARFARGENLMIEVVRSSKTLRYSNWSGGELSMDRFADYLETGNSAGLQAVRRVQ